MDGITEVLHTVAGELDSVPLCSTGGCECSTFWLCGVHASQHLLIYLIPSPGCVWFVSCGVNSMPRMPLCPATSPGAFHLPVIADRFEGGLLKTSSPEASRQDIDV